MGKDKKEQVPPEAEETVRRRILTELDEGPRTALELSGIIGIPEKDVAGHLDHIRHSLHRTGRHLVIVPAECSKCGFQFEKRERLTRPGKCPVCRSESLLPPVFSLSPP